MNVQHSEPQFSALELPLLRTFLVVAQLKSFSQAAAILERSPSSVSNQIQKLEDIIGGAQVFDRAVCNVRLTFVGLQLVDYAKRMLSTNRIAMSNFVERKKTETVQIGVSENYQEYFPVILLQQLSKRLPSTEIIILRTNPRNLHFRFERGLIDIIFIPTLMKSKDTVFSDTLIWMGARDGIAYKKNPLPLAIGQEGCDSRLVASRLLDEAGRNYRIAFLATHPALQLAAVAADLAISPLPKSLIRPDIIDLNTDNIFPLLPDLHLDMMVTGHSSPTTSVVVECIKEVLTREYNYYNIDM